MTSEFRTQLRQEIDRRARERAARIEAAEREDRAYSPSVFANADDRMSRCASALHRARDGQDRDYEMDGSGELGGEIAAYHRKHEIGILIEHGFTPATPRSTSASASSAGHVLSPSIPIGKTTTPLSARSDTPAIPVRSTPRSPT